MIDSFHYCIEGSQLFPENVRFYVCHRFCEVASAAPADANGPSCLLQIPNSLLRICQLACSSEIPVSESSSSIRKTISKVHEEQLCFCVKGGYAEMSRETLSRGLCVEIAVQAEIRVQANFLLPLQEPEVESSKMIDRLRLGSISMFKFDTTAVCWLEELRILIAKRGVCVGRALFYAVTRRW
jgi:hypothetical protein